MLLCFKHLLWGGLKPYSPIPSPDCSTTPSLFSFMAVSISESTKDSATMADASKFIIIPMMVQGLKQNR